MTVTNAFLSERIGSVGGHFANHFFSDSQGGGGGGYKETTAGKSLRSVSIVIMIMKIRMMMMMMMGTWHEISPYVKSRRFT